MTSIAVIHLAFLKPSLVDCAQPQRKSERIGDRLPGIFRRQDSLRMQRRRHVEAFGVVVGALEGDVFRLDVGADAFQKIAAGSRPTTGRCNPSLPRRCGG